MAERFREQAGLAAVLDVNQPWLTDDPAIPQRIRGRERPIERHHDAARSEGQHPPTAYDHGTPCKVADSSHGAAGRRALPGEDGLYGVSFLHEEQQHLSNHFAGRGMTDMKPEFRYLSGVPVLRQSLAVITMDVTETVACGDHSLFIGRISKMEASPTAPLLYYRGQYARLEAAARREPIDPPMFW